MATKTTAKKTTTKSATKAPAKSTKATKSNKDKGVLNIAGVGVFEEVHPENHVITGKYKVFYYLFACTTVLFMITTVMLFWFAADVMSEYDSIKACARTGNYSQCVESDSDDTTTDVNVEDTEDGDEA